MTRPPHPFLDEEREREVTHPDARSDPLDDLPTSCEWGDCDDPPDMRAKFVKPTDYVYYCEDHAFEAMQLDYHRRNTRL